MTFFRPKATLYIEKRPVDLTAEANSLRQNNPNFSEGDIEAELTRLVKEGVQSCRDGQIPAFAFPFNDYESPDNFYIECTVEYATTDAGGSTYLEATLYNISHEIVRQFQASAFVRLEAGYDAGGPGVRTIFFGNLQYVLPQRSGGEITWKLVAASNPAALHNAKVSIEREDILIGDAMKEVLGAGGLDLNDVHPYAFGLNDDGTPNPLREQEVTLEYFSAVGPLKEVFSELVEKLNSKTKRTFLAYQNNTDPFLFDVVDLTDTTGNRSLELSLDQAGVLSAGAVPAKGAMENANVITGRDCSQVNALAEASIVEEFEVTKIFDPRIHLGMLVIFEGDVEGRGTFVVSQLSHTIGGQSWQTDMRGPFGGGNVLGYAASGSAGAGSVGA